MSTPSLGLEDAILIAIANGAETPDQIARILRVDKSTVEDLLRKLEIEGFVKSEEKGKWVFKKRVYMLTERGFKRAQEALQRLQQVAEELKQKIAMGAQDEAVQLATAWSGFLPLMLWMNMLDMALLSMLPLELGFLAAADMADWGAGADTGGADHTGSDVDTGDTGDTGDMGDMGDMF